MKLARAADAVLLLCRAGGDAVTGTEWCCGVPARSGERWSSRLTGDIARLSVILKTLVSLLYPLQNKIKCEIVCIESRICSFVSAEYLYVKACIKNWNIFRYPLMVSAL